MAGLKRSNDVVLFYSGQIRVHRQTDDLLGSVIASWELHGCIGYRWLPVEWNGVVHGGGDAGCL